MRLTVLLGTALLAAATALHAQTPAPADGAKGRRHFDCSQAKDPKACEERVAKMKAAHGKASAACEGKQGDEHRSCMRQQMCAQAKDPKACEERAAKAKSAIDKARQACEAKKGNEHRDCMRREVCSQTKDPAERRCKERLRASVDHLQCDDLPQLRCPKQEQDSQHCLRGRPREVRRDHQLPARKSVCEHPTEQEKSGQRHETRGEHATERSSRSADLQYDEGDRQHGGGVAGHRRGLADKQQPKVALPQHLTGAHRAIR